MNGWTEISSLFITCGDYILSGEHVELIHGDVTTIKYNLVINQSPCLSTNVREKLKFREKFIICKQETCSIVSHWQPSHHHEESQAEDQTYTGGGQSQALQRIGAKALRKPCLKPILSQTLYHMN